MYGKKTARVGRKKPHPEKQGNALQHNIQEYHDRLCWQLTGYDGTTGVQNNTYHSVNDGGGRGQSINGSEVSRLSMAIHSVNE